MSDVDAARVPIAVAVTAIKDQLLAWLRNDALPVWEIHGVDRSGGGYFENLDFLSPRLGFEASGTLRRGRVVARQIYVFDLGRRLGWRASGGDPVAHGRDFLLTRMYAGDGRFHTAVDALGHLPQSPFSLYETAFYLFALARLQTAADGHRDSEQIATQTLASLRARFGRSLGGFEESSPPTLPLKSNPHMHLLEAALEWIDAASAREQFRWVELGRELVGLCLTRFCSDSSGAVREYFDSHWRPYPGDDRRVIEPGHQFEWAWLLQRWAHSPHSTREERAACGAAATRLLYVGEHYGVDPARGVAVNELWDDMEIKDSAAKIWPQTERVKAWCAALENATDSPAAEQARGGLVRAAHALSRYLDREPRGLWHEVRLADGSFAVGPCKASSFYHVACAIDSLCKLADPSSAARGLRLAAANDLVCR